MKPATHQAPVNVILKRSAIGLGLLILPSLTAILWWHKPVNIWASRINPQALEFWKAIATVLVALIAAAVAAGITYYLQRRQIVIAEQKLKLDMFVERFEVFRGINGALGRVIAVGGDRSHGLHEKNKARQRFFKATAPVRYLFDEAAHNFIENEVKWRINVYLDYDDGSEHATHPDDENWQDYMISVHGWLLELREQELHTHLGKTLMLSRPA